MDHLKLYFLSIKSQLGGTSRHGCGKIDGKIQVLVSPIIVAEESGVVHTVLGNFVQTLG